ncbi:MAG: Gx transporter family protein [Lachnospiraceae bacterium]|nr:Gx transporter family protein [Lachnospiraceae bacterium]
MIQKTVELGFFLALALSLAYVESLIPFSFGIPGIKLGLPNLIVVLLLYRGNIGWNNGNVNSAERSGVKEAVLVNGLRIVLSGFLFSNLYTILYALMGALFSLVAMFLGRRLHFFSVIGVSVLGGVFHNIGQIIVAMVVVETVYVGYYVPFLIISGTVTGALLGFMAMELMPYLYRSTGTTDCKDVQNRR